MQWSKLRYAHISNQNTVCLLVMVQCHMGGRSSQHHKSIISSVCAHLLSAVNYSQTEGFYWRRLYLSFAWWTKLGPVLRYVSVSQTMYYNIPINILLKILSSHLYVKEGCDITYFLPSYETSRARKTRPCCTSAFDLRTIPIRVLNMWPHVYVVLFPRRVELVPHVYIKPVCVFMMNCEHVLCFLYLHEDKVFRVCPHSFHFIHANFAFDL